MQSATGSPLIVSRGGDIRLHLTTDRYASHPLHSHNHRFQVAAKDGGWILDAARHERDIMNVAPAERYTIDFTVDTDPGTCLLHCHRETHAMNGNFYPGGMVSGLVHRSMTDTDIFAHVIDYAGFEGQSPGQIPLGRPRPSLAPAFREFIPCHGTTAPVT